jgi:hypothetical protein
MNRQINNLAHLHDKMQARYGLDDPMVKALKAELDQAKNKAETSRARSSGHSATRASHARPAGWYRDRHAVVTSPAH